MKVLGDNILIAPIDSGIKKTSYGLELSEKHRDKDRYGKAKVLHIGDAVKGVSVGDEVIYDLMSGHFIDLEEHENQVRVIKDFNIILIL